MSAYDLAEAGINDAKSVLYNQLNPDGSVKAGGTSPITPTLLPPTTIQYPDLHGSVTYSGTLDTSTYVWTITSTGKVKNGQSYQSRTLTKTVTVRGLNVGADGSSWSRFYQDSPSTCLTIDQETIVTNFATRGPLCLVNGGAITGANTTVDVGTHGDDLRPGRLGRRQLAVRGVELGRAGLVEHVERLHEQQLLRDRRDLVERHRRLAQRERLRLLDPGDGDRPRDHGQRDPQVEHLGAHPGQQRLPAEGRRAGRERPPDRRHLGHLQHHQDLRQRVRSVGHDAGPPPTSTTPASGSSSPPRRTRTGTTASVDYVSVTVTYSNDTNGIGTSGTPVKQANIGGTCTYNAQSAHTPCTSTDHVYATTITSTPAGSNPALVMPQVDFDYWWANAKPGPKHFCTNSNPGLSSTFFDNDAGQHQRAERQPHGQRRDGAGQLGLHLPGGRERRAPGRAVLEPHHPRDDGRRHDLHRRQLPLGHRRRGRPLLRPRQHHVLEGRRDRRRRLRRRQRHDARRRAASPTCRTGT